MEGTGRVERNREEDGEREEVARELSVVYPEVRKVKRSKCQLELPLTPAYFYMCEKKKVIPNHCT